MSGTAPSDCLDSDTVASYADHGLSAEEMARVERHIDGCAPCRELVSALARAQWSQDSIPVMAEEGRGEAARGERAAGSANGVEPALAETIPAEPAPLDGAVLPRGTRVGQFEIERPLDAGGMGLVYVARDTRLERRVALKGVRRSRARSDELLREAKTMAQLAHPNVVAVFDVIAAHGQLFLAMELVVGRSVRQWLDAEPRSWKAVVDAFLAAGAGLAAAHAAHIVHGDIKPANLLYGDDGRVRVTDFGLSSSPAEEAAAARATGGGDAASAAAGAAGGAAGSAAAGAAGGAAGSAAAGAAGGTAGAGAAGAAGGTAGAGTAAAGAAGADGAAVDGDALEGPAPRAPAFIQGTPAYMAPELRAGAPCDALGDQYAFCASLHEALFGALPGGAPLRHPRLPRRLRRVLARGLAADPAARYPSMTQLLRELRATRSATRRWLMAAAAATLVIGGLAYGFGGHRVEVRMCEAAAPRLAGPWNEEARWSVRRSFENARLPYASQVYQRVDENLQRWSSAFEAAHRQMCDAGWFRRAAPVETFATKLDCLEDRAVEARALVNVLRDAPDATTILNAIAATAALAPVARCEAAPPRKPADPLSPARKALSDRFAEVHALHLAGRFREALPKARSLVEDAARSGEPGLHAAALVSLGSHLVRLSDPAAEPMLLEALRLSEVAERDLLRAQAWVNLVSNEYNRGNHERVLFMKEPALGAAERVGDVFLQTELLMIIGGSLSQLGRLTEAQRLFEQTVELRRKLYGDRDVRLAAALSALGNAHAMQGNLDAGIAAHRQAMETSEATLGDHPQVASQRGNLGSDYLYGLRPAEALVEYEKAMATVEAAFSGKGRAYLGAVTDVGAAQLELGRAEEALATFERVAPLWKAQLPKHPSRGNALLGRYLALRALGRPAEVADLEEALVLMRQAPPFMRGRVQLELGLVSPPPRAAELITAAAEGLRTSTLPLVQRELRRAEAWLTAHGLAPGTTPGSAPGATPGAAPGSAPGSASGATQGSASGATQGSAPGLAPGATRGSASGSAPGATPGATQGSTSGATQGPASGATSGATQGSASGATPGATQGSAPGATQGSAQGSTPAGAGGRRP